MNEKAYKSIRGKDIRFSTFYILLIIPSYYGFSLTVQCFKGATETSFVAGEHGLGFEQDIIETSIQWRLFIIIPMVWQHLEKMHLLQPEPIAYRYWIKRRIEEIFL